MSEKGCIKCGSKDAGKKEVAMTGTGLSKIFDLNIIRLLLFIVKTVVIPSSIISKLLKHQIYWIYSLADKK